MKLCQKCSFQCSFISDFFDDPRMASVLVVKACHVNEELSVAMPDWNGCSFSFHSSCQNAHFFLCHNSESSLLTQPRSFRNCSSFSFFPELVTRLAPNHTVIFTSCCSVRRRLGCFGDFGFLKSHNIRIQSRDLVEVLLPRRNVGGDESDLIRVPVLCFFAFVSFFPAFSGKIFSYFLILS